MCGIAGLSGVLDRPIAEVMGDVIAHRGPDCRGSWDDSRNRIHLFHQRLSIIDLSTAANQPMVTSDGRYTVVYNGDTQLSELHIIDAQNFQSNPLAVVKLNARVPFGFHGNFIAD